MELILFDKGLEMSGLKKKEGMEAGASAGKVVWFLISLAAFGIALYHAYNANKCEKNTTQLLVAVALALLFPKATAIYYLFKYGLPKFDEKGMAKLSEAYQKHTKPGSWDDVKCKLPDPKSPPAAQSSLAVQLPPEAQSPSAVQSPPEALGGFDLDTMYGGW